MNSKKARGVSIAWSGLSSFVLIPFYKVFFLFSSLFEMLQIVFPLAYIITSNVRRRGRCRRAASRRSTRAVSARRTCRTRRRRRRARAAPRGWRADTARDSYLTVRSPSSSPAPPGCPSSCSRGRRPGRSRSRETVTPAVMHCEQIISFLRPTIRVPSNGVRRTSSPLASYGIVNSM